MKRPKLSLHIGQGAPAGPTGPPADAPPSPGRGVYIEEIAPVGETWYKIVLSRGKVGIVHLPDDLIGDDSDHDALLESLWRWLDGKDPVRPAPKLCP